MIAKRAAYFVRSLMPIPALRAVAQVGQFMGSVVPGESNFPSIFRSLEVLSRLGLDPGFCVDVGAYHGEWTKIFKSVFPRARMLMVEAQEGKRSRLTEVANDFGGGVDLEIALLGPTEGMEVQFQEMETGSSVFAERSPYQRTPTTRRTQTLDGLLTKNDRPRVDFLKLDVQGYELQVLAGAGQALAQAEALLLEVSVLPINQGCPSFAEVIAFVDRAGFQLFDFCSQVRRNDGVLWQTDLLFLRKGSRFTPEARLTADNWG